LALERVLASQTFGRSGQLRSFLRYVCEAEFEGRAQELNEYILGVSVLGRPADYSPAEDSCVRTRAYELRNKLRSYYLLESPEEHIQISIRKGAYAPQFQRLSEARPVDNSPDFVESTLALAPAAIKSPVAPARRKLILPAAGTIVLLTIFALILYYWIS